MSSTNENSFETHKSSYDAFQSPHISFLLNELKKRCFFLEILNDRIKVVELESSGPERGRIKELRMLIRHEIQRLTNLLEEQDQHDPHVSFVVAISKVHPNLSKSDLDLIKLIRNGLGTKEIAAIKNVEPLSIKTAKYRLKKKLQIPEEKSLSNYINSY